MILTGPPQGKTSGSRLVAAFNGRSISKDRNFRSSPQKLLVASLAATLLLTSCGGGKQVRFSSLFKEDDELTADIAFKVVDRSYRIKPDRRYLLALSDLCAIVTGQPLNKLEAVFENGKWHIKSDKKDVAEINNFPTFVDMENSLSNYARSLEGNDGEHRFAASDKKVLNMGKVFGAVETETELVYDEKKSNRNPEPVQHLEPDEKQAPEDKIDIALLEFGPRSLFRAIELINERWQHEGGSQQSIDQAATALSCLSFQVLDRAGTADELFGQAFAFAVLSKRYETENARRNMVRLAESMGYCSEAFQMAKDLEGADPLRMYMLYQAGTVGAAIDQGIDSNESKFLYIKKIAQSENQKKLEDLFHQMGENSPLGLISACCWNPSMPAIADSLCADIEPIDAEKTTSRLKFFPRLEKCFQSLTPWPKESVIPQANLTAFYRAIAYSFVLDELQPENGSYTEKEAEKIFDEKVGKPSQSEVGYSLCTLAHSILDARAGHYQVAKLLGNAVSPKDLGDYPRFLAFDETSRWFANGDAKLISAGKTIFENIDSRPENRFRAATIAHNELLDPVLALKLDKLALEEEENGPLSVKAARQDVNRELLRKIADSKTGVPSRRAQAISYLLDLAGKSDLGARNIYVDRLRDLLETSGRNLEVLRQYAHSAIAAGKTAVAIEITRKCFEPSDAQAMQQLALLYFSNGNTDEALKLLGGIPNKARYEVAEAYVNALIQKGRDAKAEAFADYYYTGNRISPQALALKTQMLWRRKAFADAALFLKEYPWQIKEENWRQNIYPVFKRTLQGFPQDITSAVRALAKEGFVEATDIGELARSFSFYGRNDVGFTILNSVLTSSFSGHELSYLNLSTLAYSYMQKTEGEKIALKWIEEKVPPQFLTPVAMFAFQNGAYDLLWKFIPENPQGIGSEYVWLSRAASMPMQNSLSKEENRLIIQHFSKNDDDALFQIGKSLIGAMDSKQLMSKRINVRELGDLAYFLGSREAYLGDQTSAANWYHMALETGINKASESARNAEAIRRLTNFYPEWSAKP